MLESIKTFLLITILIYAIVISILFWTEHINKQQYMHDKFTNLNNKEVELAKRENAILDKEVCFRELTKLQTIQNSAMSLLKSYNSSYLENIQTNTQKPIEIKQELPKVESETSSWINALSSIIG